MRTSLVLVAALAAVACQQPPPPVVYQAVPVTTRDIVVSAQAAGSIEPDTTVEVKSKASGEILDMRVETGQVVDRGTLMVRVDQRTPRNTLNQAQAQLEVAQATLANALSQKRRSDELFKSQSITETEHEQATLAYANAKASLVQAQVAVENARIRMEDTDVRAPITGTIIEKNVERGQVISSPTNDVGGGTVLLKMADLNLVQVRTLVDETDIGKLRAGLEATVQVDAYPNRPFQGEVIKIEPQAVTQQNVTMFPVLVRIQNREGLLRPGMNANVDIHVGRRDSVLAVPNAALRTPRDVASAAAVLGLSMETVNRQLAAASPTDSAKGQATLAGNTPGADQPQANTMTMGGRTVTLPEGVSQEQVRAIIAKLRSGERPTAAERAIMQKLRGGRGGGARSQNQESNYQFGGQYIVFVLEQGHPVARNVRTGLTDLDYSEVVSGLSARDSVLILPSASLVQAQQEFKDRINRVTGGGGLPGVSNNSARR